MLEQLMNSLKSQVGGQIAGQSNLPAGQIDQVFSIIGDVAKKEVTGQMMKGNLSGVMNLFTNQPNNAIANQLQSNISSGVVTNLTSKLGLSPAIAQTIASVAIPALIGLITKHNSKTPDDDPSPLNEIFGSVAKSGVFKGILGGLFRKQ